MTTRFCAEAKFDNEPGWTLIAVASKVSFARRQIIDQIEWKHDQYGNCPGFPFRRFDLDRAVEKAYYLDEGDIMRVGDEEFRFVRMEG